METFDKKIKAWEKMVREMSDKTIHDKLDKIIENMGTFGQRLTAVETQLKFLPCGNQQEFLNRLEKENKEREEKQERIIKENQKRIASLEKIRDEQKGAWKFLVAFGAIVGSISTLVMGFFGLLKH